MYRWKHIQVGANTRLLSWTHVRRWLQTELVNDFVAFDAFLTASKRPTEEEDVDVSKYSLLRCCCPLSPPTRHARQDIPAVVTAAMDYAKAFYSHSVHPVDVDTIEKPKNK